MSRPVSVFRRARALTHDSQLTSSHCRHHHPRAQRHTSFSNTVPAVESRQLESIPEIDPDSFDRGNLSSQNSSVSRPSTYLSNVSNTSSGPGTSRVGGEDGIRSGGGNRVRAYRSGRVLYDHKTNRWYYRDDSNLAGWTDGV
jgi:hypothetical protein